MGEVAAAAGYDVRPERQSYAMSHQRLLYTNASGRPAFVKVDINFLDRIPVLPPELKAVRHPFVEDLPSTELQTFAFDELAASKLIALVRRGAARDLFDIAMLSGAGEIDAQVLKTLVVVRGASYPATSPGAYDTAALDILRLSQWRSEVMALARRPLAVDFDEAKVRAALLLAEIADLGQGHGDFLSGLNDGADATRVSRPC